MQFDKSQIIDFLRSQGDQGKAEEADRELPGTVDTEEHSGLLQRLGIDPAALIAKLAGGGGIGGGLGGLLGR